MSMSKHTKGPWLPMAGMPTNIIDASGLRVARCDFDGDFTHADCLANARLIAAAPDLLDELNVAIAYLEHPEAFDRDALRRKWHALKAKAEGQ